MKRFLWMIIVLALLLCACADAETVVMPEPEALEVLWQWELEPFDPAETDRMINCMSGNRALIWDGALYCFDYDEAYAPVLARYELTEEGLGERTVLAEDCLPEYLLELDGFLYFINDRAIERLELESGERETVRAEESDFLQSKDGLLYFCDEKGRFCKAQPDGSSERVLINDECFYPWLTENAVLYQCGSDGESLHIHWLEDGTDSAALDRAVYAPVAVGERLYGTGDEGLISLGLDGTDSQALPVPKLRGAAEIIPTEGAYALRWVAEDNGLTQYTAELKDLGKLRAREVDYKGYRLCDFAGDGWRVDAWYNPDGRLRCFVLVAPDGTETEYIAGNVKRSAA